MTMKAQSQLEQSTQEEQIRAALDQHWAASDANDFETEHRIYLDDAVLEYPQSGERTRGRSNIQNQRASQPNKKRFSIRRIVGSGEVWVTELILTYDDKPSYTVSVMEFEGDKVARETQYFADPFMAPAFRAQWVERIKVTSFEADIRPLFTDRDIHAMSKAFNLASYDDVKAHASAIYDRIRGIGGAVMPPPPPRGEGPWPQSRIDLFARWLADGCKP
jgi:hypothetical protein